MQGDFVYHGHAGHFLLKGLKGVLKVRIIAPMEYRIEKIMEEKNLTPKKAKHYIENIDKQRIQWTKFLYGKEWSDPSLYDLVINIKDITISMACEMIARTVDLPEFRDAWKEKKDRENFHLACLVESKLALNKKTKGMDLNVDAFDGKIKITGEFYTSGPFPRGIKMSKDDILKVVQEVPGVRDITVDVETLSIPLE